MTDTTEGTQAQTRTPRQEARDALFEALREQVGECAGRAMIERFEKLVRFEGRIEALQDAQQVVAGDSWVDFERWGEGQASRAELIRELDALIVDESREGADPDDH